MKKRKRMITVVVSLALFGLFCLTALAAAAGDIDNDGGVSAADARQALRAAVGLETLTGDAWHIADADGNERIEAADARLILRAAVGLETLTATSAHQYGNWTVTKEATCAAEGEQTSVCSLCGGTGRKAIPMLSAHTWDAGKITKAATCAAVGIKTYTCTVCSETKTETVPKTTSHTWDAGKITTAATCKAAGVRTFTCTVCKETKTEAVAKNTANHVGGTELRSVRAATCGEAGYTGDVYCKGCNTKLSSGSSIAKLSTHTFDGGKITKAATCSATGVKTYTCTVCGAAKTETVAKNAANHAGGTQIRNAVAATCQATGYSGDAYCKGCGAKISTGTTLAKTAHSFNNGVVTKAATCSATGEKNVTCTVCGKTEVQTVPVDGSAHAYQWKNIGSGKCRQVCAYNASHTGTTASHTTQAVAAVAATCTTAGCNRYFVCTKCGNTSSNSLGTSAVDPATLVIPATGHRRMNATAAKAATCTAAGNSAYWYCLDCKTYFSDSKGKNTITVDSTSIPALGHNLVQVVFQKPTCENKGITYNKCTRCDYKTSNQFTAALGHDYAFTGYEGGAAPTCAKNVRFYGIYTCSRCGGKTTRQVDRNPDNHPESSLKYSYDIVVDPTCTEDGYVTSNTVECTLCGVLVAQNVTEIIPKTEHQMRYIAKKNATCTANGNNAYYICSECNQRFSDEAGTAVLTDAQIVIPATGHRFTGDYTKYFVRKTTCTVDGTYYLVRSCANDCGAMEVKNSAGAVNVYSASGFRTLVAGGQNTFTEPAPGHQPSVYFEAREATCTEPARTAGWGCPVCETPTEGMVEQGEPNGHKYTITDSPLGTNAESFYCTVCHEKREDLLSAYNNLVNLIKSGPMQSENVTYFSKNVIATDYTKLSVSGIISMIPGLKNSFRDEIRQTETTFSTGQSTPRRSLYIRNLGKVSKLVDKDVTALTVNKQTGLNIATLLDSSYGSSVTVGSTTRNVDPYRQVQIPGEVIAVTVKINTETFVPGSGISGVGPDEESALEHLTGEDIRYHMEGFEEDGTHTEVEDDDGLKMTSVFKLKKIISNGNATYYFAANTLEPLAAVYNTSIVSSQDIKMTIEMGSLKGSITADPTMTENEQTVFLFKAVTDLV